MTVEIGDVQREDFLARLKRHDGAKHPYLCKVVSGEENSLKLTWMTHCGFGAVSYSEISEEHAHTAEALLKSGRLVPTNTHENAVTGTRTQYLTLMENVNWGVAKDGHIVIFELPRFKDFPDIVIRPSIEHETALHILKQRLAHKKAVLDNADITLSDGTVVTPVVQNPDLMRIRMRQNAPVATPS